MNKANDSKSCKNINNSNYNIQISLKCLIIILFNIILFIFASFSNLKNTKNDFISNNQKTIPLNNENIIENNTFLDKFENNVYNKIKIKLESNKCSQMWGNQKEFLNGVIRKFRPKKIVEIGVAEGGGTCIILNAIQDIENAHLYSIDLSDSPKIGKCVRDLFPNLLNKWTLFTGNVAAKFLEQIGKDIDMVFIDSAHFEPGEILDFLIVLPFLKEGAIVGFHDIANQITHGGNNRNEWSPYIIFNLIRGKPFYPSGNILLKHDIGIKILESNQKKYHHDYFRALGGQWQYFPKEKYIELLIKYFKKYYDNDCSIIFSEAVEFNRNFVKKNPKIQIYRYNSD